MADRQLATRVSGLCKSFAGKSVLRDVSCHLFEGEIIALTGANGTGKTTFLSCLAGMIRPDAGEVYSYERRVGCDVSDRRKVGIVSHEPQLYSHLTMRENLLFAARMCAVPRPSMHVDDLLQSHGLIHGADSPSDRLSQGMRKRYSVLRALVHDPCIVLLDEPFVSLDSSGCDWLANVMRTLRQQQRVLCFATHDVQWSYLQPDRVFHLERGALSEVSVQWTHPTFVSRQPIAA